MTQNILLAIEQFSVFNSKIAKLFRSSIKVKHSFFYFTYLIFIALLFFLLVSIKNYINDTIPTQLLEPDSDQLEIENEEQSFSALEIIIKKGDTLNSILANQRLPKNDISQIIALAKKHKISSKLQVGQKIIFDYETRIIDHDIDDLAEETKVLSRITFVIDKLKSLEFIRKDEGFITYTSTVPVDKFMTKSQAVIKSNLMSTLKSIGIPANSIIELINSYSYQIDFQRQLKQGDTVTVISEKYLTKDGEFSHHGNVLYASLNLSGKDYNIYRYEYDKSRMFFSEDGKSVKRNLLKTPVKITKISSHYGNRKHPTLGYTKMHKGVDFAAPIGTPIYSAGNGVVTEMGTKSGYGKYIQIKHSPNLSTAYAHASKFAQNLKIGSTVKQGQVIAYVGMTGRTTGPHLHYEVKISGQHVNPMSIKTAPGIELTGARLSKFHRFKNDIMALSSKLDAAENAKILAQN